MANNASWLGNHTSINHSLAQINGSRQITVTGPKWTFTPTFYTAIAVTSFLTNGTVMVFFLFKPSLRTPFNIYLMNLVITNFLFTCLKIPADTINTLYSGWWLSAGYCTLNQYGTYALGGGIRVSHTLITVNRLWAVLWPHSYRQNHGFKMAIAICFVGWVFVNAFVVPGLVKDVLYYRYPLNVSPCRINSDAQWGWFFALQIVVFTFTFIIVVGSYPVIWFMRRKRNHMVKPAKTSKTARPSQSIQTSRGKGDSLELNRTADTRQSRRQSGRVSQHTTQTDPGDLESSMTQRPGAPVQRIRRSSKAFTILTLMTMAVFVYWMPILIFYHMSVWMPVNFVLFQVAIIMSAMQSVVDPILFACALPDLRDSFLSVLRRNRF